MKLEVGKSYRTADGQVHGPIKLDQDFGIGGKRYRDEMGNWYTESGQYWQQGPHCPFNLISQV